MPDQPEHIDELDYDSRSPAHGAVRDYMVDKVDIEAIINLFYYTAVPTTVSPAPN